MTNADASKSASAAPEQRLSDDIPTLEAEIATLTLQREKIVRLVRDLRADENPKTGVFHPKEIFEAQQEKLRLDVEIQFRTNKINRIKLGMEDASRVSPGVKNGFLF